MAAGHGMVKTPPGGPAADPPPVLAANAMGISTAALLEHLELAFGEIEPSGEAPS